MSEKRALPPRPERPEVPVKRWTTDHGPDTYRQKFNIIQKKTGLDLSEGEFTFVLRPETDPAAFQALEHYCRITDHQYSTRNAHIREELNRIIRREVS